ncbi:MAG: GTPase Era [Gemmatimonadota bacterium]|nr:GTPase Era [Gemmatimonadota bacterium]
MTRAGTVTVAGKPNAGKSTLLNRLVGQKLSITSDKPQSTRDRVVGIRTQGDTQMILADTPGLLDPGYLLQTAMQSAAVHALADADCIVYVCDARDGIPVPLGEAAGLESNPRATTIVALNKADLLRKDDRASLAASIPDGVFISALTGEGIPELIDRIEPNLPESPFLFPEEDVSIHSLRFLAAELIRETALEQLGAEVPYSIACEIEEFREDRSPIYVRAVIHVERDSQKRILIGEKGRRIKLLGTAARKKIETLVGGAVYLDLWVKVLQNWRKDAAALRRFGYNSKD